MNITFASLENGTYVNMVKYRNKAGEVVPLSCSTVQK